MGNKKTTTTKKTTKKVIKKSYSQEEINKMMDAVKAETVRVKDDEFEQVLQDRELNDEASLESVFNDESETEVEDENPDEDYFNKVERTFVKEGISVIYKIKKNGQFLADMYHPISWASLQEEHGGGHYLIQARNASTGRILKATTESIHPPAKTGNEEKAPIVVPQQQQPQFDPNMLLQVFQQLQESTTKREDRGERDDKRLMAESSKSHTDLIIAQQKTSQDMFMQMQTSQQDMFKNMQEIASKAQESTNKLIEKMDDKMHKQIDSLTKNQDKGVSAVELQKLLSEAKKEAKDDERYIQEKIDEKVEERAASGSDDSGGGNLTKLVASIIPAITLATQQMSGRPQPQAQPRQIRRTPQAQPAQPYSPRPQGPVQQAQPQGQPVTNEVPQNNVSYKTDDVGLMGLRKNVEPMTINKEELAKIQMSTPTIVPEIVEEINEPGDVFDPGKDLLNLMDKASPMQDKIVMIAIPVISERLDDSPIEVSQAVLKLLIDDGITSKEVLENLSFEQLWELAVAFGQDNTKQFWFEEFYADLTSSATHDDGKSGSSEAQRA